jgi:hypothetical protein
MSNARDKANIPALNFSSTGIDDNATSTAITIDSDEYVGIGTTSPTSGLHIESNSSAVKRRLRIAYDGSYYYDFLQAGAVGLYFNSVGGLNHVWQNNGSEVMRIAGNNVGIGTSSPSYPLDVQKASGDVFIRAKGNSSTAGGIFRAEGADAGSFPGLHTAQGGTNYWSIGQRGDTNLHLNRESGSGNVIVDAGNVGIGTTSFNYGKLEVANSGYSAFAVRSTDASGAIAYLAANLSSEVRMGSISNHPLSIRTANTERMRIDSSGNVGIGTSNPSEKLDVTGDMIINCSGGNKGLTIKPTVNGSTSILLDTTTDNSGNRNWGIRNRYNGFGRFEIMRGTTNTDSPLTTVLRIDNDSSATFTGSLSKASGSFKIDHPLSSKTNTHHLVHSFVEAPQADNIYRGKIDLVNGTATVNIDTVAGMSEGTFVLLNREVQCFTSNETGWTAVKGSVSGNILTITAQDNTCTDTISWLVIGERKDQHMYDTSWTDENGKVIVEPLKEIEQSIQ